MTQLHFQPIQGKTLGIIDAIMRTEGEKDRFTMCYRDGGVPFNPLKNEPPDFSLPIAQRQMGGLGIYLALTSMDTAEYEFVNGENVFTTSLFYKK